MMPTTLPHADLFGDIDQVHAFPAAPRHSSLSRSERASRRLATHDHEVAARLLDASEDYRVLRRLKPREVNSSYRLGPGEFVAAVIDVETTGLDHKRDEVIEIGMVVFVHDAAGHVGPVIGALNLLREPSIEISSTITRLTGITPEMVAGHVLDVGAVQALLEPVDLLIAHNAKFDRNFCGRLHDDFMHKAWLARLPRWAGRTSASKAKLGYLVNQNGWFHHGHRAVDDCHALLEVLAAPLPDGTGMTLGRLLASSQRTRVRVWAQYAPFNMKDVLKSRGYRWNSGDDERPKAWWTEVDAEVLDVKLRFLEQEVYLREVDLRREHITAYERYRAP